MIKNLNNPVELFIFIHILSLVTPPSRKKNQQLNRTIAAYIGKNSKEKEELAKTKLEAVNDREKIVLAKESLKKLEEEDIDTKKKIMSLIEEIIFFDHHVAPAERKFYDMAKKCFETESYSINPSTELFEYLNVLSYVSRSEFAKMHSFIHIWKKYMGPDVIFFHDEAQKNLKNLSLEDQVIRISENLKKMSEISLEEKTDIKLMVEEIILVDSKFTKQEKVMYNLLLENLNLEDGLEDHIEKFRINKFFLKIALNPLFHHSINFIIVLTGILVGLETDRKMAKDFSIEFQLINNVIQYIFVTEILIRFLALWNKPKEFFSDFWNLSDLILVIASFLPFGNYPFILRLLRLARFIKIFKELHQLRIISVALLRSIKPTGFVCVLLSILIYIYGVIGTTLFSENDPINFGTLAVSMSSLLQTTFEGWTDILYIQMYGCKNYGYSNYGHLCNETTSQPIISLIYFISFIVLNGLIIVNLVIGIIIDNMNVTKEKLEKEDEIEKTVKNIDFIVSKIRSERIEKMIIEKEN